MIIQFVSNDVLKKIDASRLMYLNINMSMPIEEAKSKKPSEIMVKTAEKLMKELISFSLTDNLLISNEPNCHAIESLPVPIYADYDNDGIGIGCPIDTRPSTVGVNIEFLACKYTATDRHLDFRDASSLERELKLLFKQNNLEFIKMRKETRFELHVLYKDFNNHYKVIIAKALNAHYLSPAELDGSLYNEVLIQLYKL